MPPPTNLEPRVAALEKRCTALEQADIAFNERLTQLEETVAGLIPCPPSPTPVEPTLVLSSNSIGISADEGEDATAIDISLTAHDGVMQTPVAATPSAAWVSNVAISGAMPNWNAHITFDTDGLVDGVHVATIAFSAVGASNNPRTLTITLTVNDTIPPDIPPPPDFILLSEPDQFAFNGTFGQPTPAAQFISLYSGGTGSLNLPAVTGTSDPDSIIASAVITTIGPQEWRLTVTPASGKPAGTYNATVTVASSNQGNPAIVIPITLVIATATIPLTLSLSQNVANISCFAGQDATTINVGLTASGTGTLNTPTAGAPSAAWVSGVVITGSHPTWSAQIAFNTDSLAIGNYSATIDFSSSNSTNNPRTLTINLTVASTSAVVYAPLNDLPRKENGQPIAWDLVNNKPAENMWDFETIHAPTGVVHLVPSQKTLNQAWADADYGDDIVVAAGTTHPKLVLTPKAGTGWINIRSSNYTNILLSRVTEADRPDMAKIKAGTVNEAALRFMAQAHHVRFIGIIFQPVDNASLQGALVTSLPVDGGWSTIADAPHDYVLDRCIFDAPAGTNVGMQRGWAPGGYNEASVGCRYPNCSDVNTNDSQNICTWERIQRLHIHNNYLGPATENIMFGGANQSALSGSYVDTEPVDIMITNNEFKGDAGVPGSKTRKNLFESKNSYRGVMHGNVFHGYRIGQGSHETVLSFWAATQSGSGPANATKCRHWTIRGNLFKDNTGDVIGISGNGGTIANEVGNHIEFSYNYGWGYFPQNYGHGPWNCFVRTCYANTFSNNVFVGWPSTDIHIEVTTSYPLPPAFGATIRSNAFVQLSTYGWGISGGPPNTADAMWGVGNWCVTHNFVRSANVNSAGWVGGTPNNVGTNVVLASNAAFGFTNLATFDLSLQPTSPLKNAGHDGRDVGGHWASFQANIANVETG